MSHTFAEVRRHAPLFRNLVRREIRQRYKASAFGLIWTLVNPAIMVTAYWFVFRFLFPSDMNSPYALFLLVGMTAWGFFMTGSQSAASSLVSNANLVTKVRFPRQIVPLAAMAGQWFTVGAMLVVTVPLCLLFGKGSKVTWLAVPPVLILLCVLTAGFSLLVSSVNVYLRDTEHILAALSLPWFFLSPIFYSLDLGLLQRDQWAADLLHYGNFLSPFILAFRDPLFFGRWPAGGDLLYCAIAAPIMLVIGILVFRSLDAEMAVEL